MPSSYTTLLKFELPVQGELSGTWGNVVNTAITTPISEAIAGTTSITVGATDYTLTNGDGSTSNEARRMFITATGSPGAARNVICPASSKLYVFTNSTSGGFAMTLKTSAGSGIAVPAGQSRLLYCNGTNVVEAVNGFGSISLTTALAATSGGTGQSSFAVGDLLYASSTTALSKLTVGATNAVLTVAAGIPSWTATLPVASGGTGAATLSGLVVGNATSAFTALAPSIGDVYKIPKITPIDAFTAQWTKERFAATDAEVRTGTSTDYAVTPQSLRNGALVQGTVQNSTSGTSIPFTSIPSWVKRITVMFNGVSTNGSSQIIFQLGTSSGFETSGYAGGGGFATLGTANSNGFLIADTSSASAAYVREGQYVFHNMTGNVWTMSGVGYGATALLLSSGTKSLGGVLDRVRVTTVNGTDTFDAGQINIMYE